ncbi:MAG: hypothetical protein ABSH50_33180 [Bryobacteraceae bacterium]|jgi:hypothetical protein
MNTNIDAVAVFSGWDPSQIEFLRGPILITFSGGTVTISVGDPLEFDPVFLSAVGSQVLRSTAALFADPGIRDQVLTLAEATSRGSGDETRAGH